MDGKENWYPTSKDDEKRKKALKKAIEREKEFAKSNEQDTELLMKRMGSDLLKGGNE